MDDSNNTILCCVWGRDDFILPPLSLQAPLILYLKNAKVSTYCGFSLNVNEDSTI